MDVDTAIFVFFVMLALVGLFILIRHLIKQSRLPPPGPPVADVARAFQIVWVQIYKMSSATSPSVEWITGSALNCANGKGWKAPGSLEGECVAGLSWYDTKRSQVAWAAGTKISDGSFAHELGHQYLDIIGQPDPNHTGPLFAPGGLKDQANQALKAANL